MRNYRLYSLAGASVVSMVLASSAQAQSSSALIGTVVDAATKKPLQNVQVVATSNSLQGEQTVETDASGTYRLPNLPAGSYTLQFFRGGYKPLTSPKPIIVRAGQTIRFNAPIQAEGTQEIEIIIEAPSVDVAKSSTGTSIDTEMIKRLPVVAPAAAPTKSFEAIAVMTPGAQSDQYGTSIGGTTSPENGYKIDGVSVGNPAYGTNGSGISLEFLSEVQVISGGYMPEYGRSTGGTISATTRSGSNEFHGTAWISASPGALEGKRQRIKREVGSIVTETKLAYLADAGAVVDGPIIKDKLWFGAGLQVSRQRYNFTRGIWARQFKDNGKIEKDSEGFTKRELVPDSTTQEVGQASQLQAFGKLTYALNPDHRISLTTFYSPYKDGDSKYLDIAGGTNNRNLNGQIDGMNRSQTGNSTDVALRWLGAADNKRWTFDTSLAMHREIDNNLPRDGSKIGENTTSMNSPAIVWGLTSELPLRDFEPEAASNEACNKNANNGLEPCEARRYRTGGAGTVNERLTVRYQLKHTTGRSFVAAGHHNAKVGIDIEATKYQHRKAVTGGRVLVDRDTNGFTEAGGFGVLSGPDQITRSPYLDNTTSMQVYGAFIQDSWSIMDKVTLNAGLRYDGLTVQGNDGQTFITLPMQLAPRVGLIWDPTQKGKSKIFAQYARYYQGMALNMADRLGSIDSSVRTSYDRDICAKLLKEDPTKADACYESSDRVRFNSSHTSNLKSLATAASKTAVDPNLKPQYGDEISAGAEYNVLANAKVGLYYQKRWLGRIIEDVSMDDGNTYFLANPNEGIATAFVPAERKYDAVQLVFTKMYNNHWLANASYQWSKTRGNVSGVFRPETGQLDPNITSDFDLIDLMVNRTGYLPADRRHEIKVFAGGDYPIGNRFVLDGGIAMNTRSGTPTNYLGYHRVYRSGESFLLKRGAGERMPWRSEINLNLSGTLRVGKTGRIKGSIEVFNVANFQKMTAMDQNYGMHPSLLPLENSTSVKDLEKAAEEAAETLANSLNTSNGVADKPNDPKFVTPERVLQDRITNPNFGKATSFQAPRSFRFTLRYEF